MVKSLVIVESPAKARTINRFLGNDATVKASMGHIRDLPRRSIGVDLQGDFKPEYVMTQNGKKVMKELKSQAKGVDEVFLATDPDREGEAIAWHLYEVLEPHTKAQFHRVNFHEITNAAIQHAFESPESVDLNKVNAQQARRVLDRLVGYKVSPLLWRNIRKGTSAGRVQSVALRLVCEREREILNFVPVEYWTLTGLFLPQGAETDVEAKLAKLDGEKPNIPDQQEAEKLASELEQSDFIVSDVARKTRNQRPKPPFITSTLQQSASGKLRFSTRQTMQMAQQLYEGVEIGSEGAVGLITYMRTDSVAVSKEAQTAAREFIEQNHGKEYVPNKPQVYKSRESSQEAHEAIRPTDIRRKPEDVKKFLNARQFELYQLIYNRFLASQMASAKLEQHSLDISPKPGKHLTHEYIFRTTVTKTVFPGYKKVYEEDEDQKGGPELPDLQKNHQCSLKSLDRKQNFTEPPRRFSEATLVRELEQNGVGRPSTYSSIVNTIQEREYVTKEKGLFIPTELGFKVNDYLVQMMDELFQVGFTADMENKLDAVEDGKIQWTNMLREFYKRFEDKLGDDQFASIPEWDKVQKLVQCFVDAADSIQWAEPVVRGARTYDDSKFCESLRKQVFEKEKVLSERQWQTLLLLVAKYRDQLPELRKLVTEFGLEQPVDEMAEQERQRAEKEKEQLAQPKDPAVERMLNALESVSEWQAPQKRGRRTYDDKKFFTSLKRQSETGKPLSDAQKKALQKLVLKYKEQLPDGDELVNELGLAEIEKQQGGVTADEAQPIVELLDEIKEWAEPRTVRGRTYNDQEFVESIRNQLKSKGRLSDRQFAALKKLLSRYHNQIDNFEERAAALGLTVNKEKEVGQKVGKCPECGAQLVVRRSRRGVFYGCEKYPECKFASNELPPQNEPSKSSETPAQKTTG